MKGWRDIGIKTPGGAAFLGLGIALFFLLFFSSTAMAQAAHCGAENSETLCSICGDGICAPGEVCSDDCPQAICGDLNCEVGEDCIDDCGDSCEILCGDSICSADEDELTCPDDCGGALCGDQSCDKGEDCPEDCGLCQATCGDGDIEPEEVCDDGNEDSGDGCDSTCIVEENYECAGEPSDCVTDCLPEICDDLVDNDCDQLSDCADSDCDGSTCMLGDACRGDGLCSGGSCQAGEVVSCEDNDVCTEDSCDPVEGCGHADIPGCGAASPVPTPALPPNDDGLGEEPDDVPAEVPSAAGEGWSCALNEGSSNRAPNFQIGIVGGLLFATTGLRLRLRKRLIADSTSLRPI